MYIHLCLCMCVCVHACVCTYICAYICHHTYALCVFVCVYAHINAPKSALGGTECVHTVCTQSVRAYRRNELGRPCAHVCGCPAIEVIVQRVYRKLIHVVKNLYVYMSCIYINIHMNIQSGTKSLRKIYASHHNLCLSGERLRPQLTYLSLFPYKR